MPIILTEPIMIAGALVAVDGTTKTYNAAFEADQVAAGKAKWAPGSPAIGGRRVPLEVITDSAQGLAKSVQVGDRMASVGDFRAAGRKKLMVFGNSIAAQSDDFLHASTSTIAGGDIAANSNVLNVASGAAFTNGQTIAVPLYHGELFTTTITAINSNAITIANKTPGLIRNASTVRVFTVGYRPTMDAGAGLASAAVALLGGPVDLVGVYGYGGANIQTMLADLDRFLRYFRPHYVIFHIFENDLVSVNGTSIDQLKAFARQAAWACLEHGAGPIVCSSLPYNQIPAARAAAYDAVTDYLVNQLATDVPGSVGVNCSTQWLDTSNPTYPRSPVAGVSDGVHLNVNVRFSSAEQTLVPVLKDVLPAAPASLLDYCLSSREISAFAGVGGAATNLQAGSVIPVNHTARAYGTALAETSKNPDGSMKLVGAWSANVGRNTDYISDAYTLTVPPAWVGGKQIVKGYLRLRINSMQNVSQIYPSFQPSGGVEPNDYNPGVDFALSIPTDGRVIVFETPAFSLPPGTASISCNVLIRPREQFASAAAIDVDLIEMGLLPAVPGIF